MVIAEYLGFGIAFVGVLGVVWRTASTTKSKVSGRSFGEYKKEVRETYVENKMCDLTHKHVKETLDRLEKGQGKIFDLIKNGGK